MPLRTEILLKRIRLLDSDGTLSFTSVMQYMILAKVSYDGTVDCQSFLFLLLILAHANLKKFSRHKLRQLDDAKAAVRDDQSERFDKIESDLNALKQAAQFSKIGR